MFERNEQVRAPSSSLVHHIRWTDSPQFRKRDASTSSTQSSSHTNQNSTISSRWRLRRRSTRSSGANDRTRRTFCYLPTVRGALLIAFRSPLPTSSAYRQDDQAMESVRKAVAGRIREQSYRWPELITSNPVGNAELMQGCKENGMHSFGPLWDS